MTMMKTTIKKEPTKQPDLSILKRKYWVRFFRIHFESLRPPVNSTVVVNKKDEITHNKVYVIERYTKSKEFVVLKEKENKSSNVFFIPIEDIELYK